MYGSNAFVSSLSASSLDRMVKLQKKALRGILNYQIGHTQLCYLSGLMRLVLVIRCYTNLHILYGERNMALQVN